MDNVAQTLAAMGPRLRGVRERRGVTLAAVSCEAEPVAVKLGVWVSNTKSRRDKLTAEQLDALRKLGMQWAQ